LGKLDLITYLSTTLNTGHAWGRGKQTLILPVLARDEELQPTTQESMFNFVRLSDGGQVHLYGPRPEVDIIASVAQHVLWENSPVDWQALKKHCTLRQMIAHIIPGYEQIGEIDQTRKEFHLAGRTFHEARFPTPSGKAHFKVNPLPPVQDTGNQLRLMTVRSEGQFNTVVYEEADIYRGQERRDVILLNGKDIARLKLHVDQEVTVRSEVGHMSNVRVRQYDIRAGNALMYFPEANVLVPGKADPRSKTPAFKSVLISIEPAQAASALDRQRTPSQGRVPLALAQRT
jgi:anaerobic selenocysteine-containing dehydrogenase